MRIIALFLVLSCLFYACSAGQVEINSTSPGYLLGTWNVIPPSSLWGANWSNSEDCFPLGTVDILPDESNSSAVYLVVYEWAGFYCAPLNFENSTEGTWLVAPYPANSSYSEVSAINKLQTSLNPFWKVEAAFSPTSMSQMDFSGNIPPYYNLIGVFERPIPTYNETSDSEDSDDNSSANSTPQTAQICDITVNSTIFNLSIFATADMIFNSVDPLGGKLSFSICQNNTNTCNNDEEETTSLIWSTYEDNNGICYDVATQIPNYALLNNNDTNQGIVITFPMVEASNASNRSFQLIVNLECDLDAVNANQTAFTMSLFANDSANLETMTVNGSSIYGCPIMLSQTNASNTTTDISDDVDEEICQFIILESDNIFNLCPFNQSNLFTISDILGGSLSFGLAISPIAECTQGHNVWAVYNDNSNNCSEVATQNPSFSLFNETDPNQGLQITFPASQAVNVRNFQLVVNLLCNIDNVDPSQTPFTMNLFATDEGDIEIITVTGRTIYGCSLDPDANTETIQN